MPRYTSTGIAVASHGKQKPRQKEQHSRKDCTQVQPFGKGSPVLWVFPLAEALLWFPPFTSVIHLTFFPPKCRDQRCQTVAVWRGDISLCILVEPILQIPGGFHSERSCVRTLRRTSQWASVLLPVCVCGGGSGSWGLVRMRQHTVYFALAPLQPALVEETAVNTQQQLCARDLVLFFLTPAIA